jgi:hypothetical protein
VKTSTQKNLGRPEILGKNQHKHQPVPSPSVNARIAVVPRFSPLDGVRPESRLVRVIFAFVQHPICVIVFWKKIFV